VGTNQRSAIVMSDDEITEFIEQSRTCTLASIGPTGRPHLVAMWYGVIDGKLYFETKAKSQKVQNLRRDPRITAMIEAGDSYDQLRGVSIEGTAAIIDDTDDKEYWACAQSVFERYNDAPSDGSDVRPILEFMMNKRVVVRIDPDRLISWDHRKLGQPAMPVGGTTAKYL
jgi:PPOX class probable F420-dependent enzyme